MRIGFHLDHFSLRGVSQASYDYADYLEVLYGFEIIIIRCHSVISSWFPDQIAEKFFNRFRVIEYEWPNESLKSVAVKANLDAIYLLSDSGVDKRLDDMPINSYCHAVFPTGDFPTNSTRFAVISDWLSEEFYKHSSPIVPHIIRRAESLSGLRAEFGIPNHDLVLGCLGGRDNFNLKPVISAITKCLELRSDLWLILLNQVAPIRHSRFLQIPGSSDLNYVNNFIETCDYMIHGRADGETFGISCGQFCSFGKPVIAWEHAPQRAHLDYFANSNLRFRNTSQLTSILLGLEKVTPELASITKSLAIPFSPELVTKAFIDTFINSPETASQKPVKVQHIGFGQNITRRINIRYLKRRIRVSLQRKNQLEMNELQ